MESFFDVQGAVYVGRDPARGPWSEAHCHAGPVAGALARSVERLFGSEKQLVRLTIDLIRPVPMEGFEVRAEVTREGRRLGTASAELVALDGTVCGRATGMLIAGTGWTDYPTASTRAPAPLDQAQPGDFPIRKALHDKPFFTHFVELRYPEGQTGGPGAGEIWLRTPAIVVGEAPSAFQRLCPLADCGNAIGRNAEITEFSFLNTDLTIVAHRASDEDWLLSRALSHWHPNGIGLAEAHLSDSKGPIATALQSLVLEPV